MLKILIITASTRPIRRGGKVSQWFKTVTDSYNNFAFEYVDLAELNLPFLDEPNDNGKGAYQKGHTKHWSSIVGSADGFIFITPEYNHGYPAPLKNAIDFLYAEWNRKPVAFVGYGFTGGLRSVQQLREIAVGVEMASIKPQVVIRIGEDFNDSNELEATDTHRVSAIKMLDDLAWWAETLAAKRKI